MADEGQVPSIFRYDRVATRIDYNPLYSDLLRKAIEQIDRHIVESIEASLRDAVRLGVPCVVAHPNTAIALPWLRDRERVPCRALPEGVVYEVDGALFPEWLLRTVTADDEVPDQHGVQPAAD